MCLMCNPLPSVSYMSLLAPRLLNVSSAQEPGIATSDFSSLQVAAVTHAEAPLLSQCLLLSMLESLTQQQHNLNTFEKYMIF